MPSPLFDEQRLAAAMDDWARQCGRRLRDRRKELRWKQPQLAELAGVTVQTISKAELGVIVPKDALRLTIASALLCEVADIWPPIERAYAHAVARAVA